jgi:hypothetical protein
VAGAAARSNWDTRSVIDQAWKQLQLLLRRRFSGVSSVEGVPGLLEDPQLSFAGEILTTDPSPVDNDRYWMWRGVLGSTTTVEIRGRIAGFTYTLFSTTISISEHQPNAVTQPELLRYILRANTWRYQNKVLLPIHGPIVNTSWQMPAKTQPNMPSYALYQRARMYQANKSPLVFIQGPLVDTRWQPVPRSQPNQAQYASSTNSWRYRKKEIFVP